MATAFGGLYLCIFYSFLFYYLFLMFFSIIWLRIFLVVLSNICVGGLNLGALLIGRQTAQSIGFQLYETTKGCYFIHNVTKEGLFD